MANRVNAQKGCCVQPLEQCPELASSASAGFLPTIVDYVNMQFGAVSVDRDGETSGWPQFQIERAAP